MRNRRGSVLLEVLMMAVVASIMCATILRARLQPALTAASGIERVSSGLAAQAAVNRVSEVWGRLGVCASDVKAEVYCSGMGCACSCLVSPGAPAGSKVIVKSSPSGGACALTADVQ
jgi:hypothetical protein